MDITINNYRVPVVFTQHEEVETGEDVGDTSNPWVLRAKSSDVSGVVSFRPIDSDTDITLPASAFYHDMWFVKQVNASGTDANLAELYLAR